jgi:hypothetical protein
MSVGHCEDEVWGEGPVPTLMLPPPPPAAPAPLLPSRDLHYSTATGSYLHTHPHWAPSPLRSIVGRPVALNPHPHPPPSQV